MKENLIICVNLYFAEMPIFLFILQLHFTMQKACDLNMDVDSL